MTNRFIAIVLFSLLSISCTKSSSVVEEKKEEPQKQYATKNVIILVVDGPRLSETWNNTGFPNIPNRIALMPQAAIVKNFHNDGKTETNPGHAAIMTGFYEPINNSGLELPQYPSFFQQWLKYTKQPKDKAWVIASKDKLEVLADCKLESWKGTFNPSTDCGVSGNGSGYRDDAITIANTKKVMADKKPNLIIINVKDVDSYGHAGDWNKYLGAIKTTDAYIKELWDYIQSQENYKDKTTFFVTNDHGRHLDGLLTAYKDHGDKCGGCTNIELMAFGPDFKKDYILYDKPYGQVDIATTAAKLLKLPLEFGYGNVMEELFK
jgi:predicted AlkP superfamily pyrophosphatase or phosphodiesterase